MLGLSDHTPGHSTVLGAVTLGASVIEKHFTSDTTLKGPDHKFSMDYRAWSDMVNATRELELALGSEEKKVMKNELETVVLQRSGVRVKYKLNKGTILKNGDLEVLRPCTKECLPPYMLDSLIGRVLTCDLSKGECIKIGDFE